MSDDGAATWQERHDAMDTVTNGVSRGETASTDVPHRSRHGARKTNLVSHTGDVLAETAETDFIFPQLSRWSPSLLVTVAREGKNRNTTSGRSGKSFGAFSFNSSTTTTYCYRYVLTSITPTRVKKENATAAVTPARRVEAWR